MTLNLLRQQRTIVRYEYSSGNSGIAASGGTNQWLSPAGANANPGTVEAQAQRRSGAAFRIWRLTGGFTRGAPTSQATLTARVNGVSQGSTALVIGTALGILGVDLATSILTVKTDLIGILFVTTTTDTGSTHPTGQIIGEVLDSF